MPKKAILINKYILLKGCLIMNKKIIRAIIPLCIFILFISISLQEYNHKYNNTEVVEAMINNEEEISEENNDKSENKSKIDKAYIKVKMNGIKS